MILFTCSSNYDLGPVFGSMLHDVGGFALPFLVGGMVMLFLAIAVFLIAPDMKKCKEDSSSEDSKVLNIRVISKVVRTKIITLLKYQFFRFPRT